MRPLATLPARRTILFCKLYFGIHKYLYNAPRPGRFVRADVHFSEEAAAHVVCRLTGSNGGPWVAQRVQREDAGHRSTHTSGGMWLECGFIAMVDAGC